MPASHKGPRPHARTGTAPMGTRRAMVPWRWCPGPVLAGTWVVRRTTADACAKGIHAMPCHALVRRQRMHGVLGLWAC